MSGNRKILRDNIKKYLKSAKKSVPPESRKNIRFSDVFKLMKNSPELGRANVVEGQLTDENSGDKPTPE